ncbi:hypothetical protein [Budvicia diplopodorum]|nr:hypothetical protein [Budvicia diplopodorum]
MKEVSMSQGKELVGGFFFWTVIKHIGDLFNIKINIGCGGRTFSNK